MICRKRSTRVLPGLSQALDWLRQTLPPGEGKSSPELVPVRIRPRPQARRPTSAEFRPRGNDRRDWS